MNESSRNPQQYLNCNQNLESNPDSIESKIQLTSMNNEPTITDLLKIIQKQNEQIITLQKQVTGLLEVRNVFKPIENNPTEDNQYNKTQDVDTKFLPHTDKNKGNKNILPKFSIDVMTSFEVSIRPQHCFPPKNIGTEYRSNEPKITEIFETSTETTSDSEKENTSKNEVSLHLTQPIPVQEKCPSPVQSIHVDMQDYSSE